MASDEERLFHIGGHDFALKALNFGQFRRIAPLLPGLTPAPRALDDANGLLLAGIARTDVVLQILQIIVGDECRVDDLRVDLDGAALAVDWVLDATGLSRKAPTPGEAKPPGRKAPRRASTSRR